MRREESVYLRKVAAVEADRILGSDDFANHSWNAGDGPASYRR